jgi:hypothetical protein
VRWKAQRAALPPVSQTHIFGVPTSFSIFSRLNFARRPILTSPTSTFRALQIERQRSRVRDEHRSRAHTSRFVIRLSTAHLPLHSHVPAILRLPSILLLTLLPITASVLSRKFGG